MNKFLRIILLSTLFATLASCSSNTSTPVEESSKLDPLTQAWYDNCQKDYRTFECLSAISKYVSTNFSENVLRAELPTYIDKNKITECKKDPESVSCIARLSDYRMNDVNCTNVSAFGPGYYCYVGVLLINESKGPFDGYITAELYDEKENQFAPDISGSFTFPPGLSVELDDKHLLKLNPGKFETVYFAFSIPSLENRFTRLRIYDSWNESQFQFNFYLCKKNSGDTVDWGTTPGVTYEDGRYLNSCSRDESGNYVNKVDGSIS